MRYEKAKKCLR